MNRFEKSRFPVPDSLMVPAWQAGVKRFPNSADSWKEDELVWLRQQLGPEWRWISLLALKDEFINIRKSPERNGGGAAKIKQQHSLLDVEGM